MNIEQYTENVEECWNTCPLNVLPESGLEVFSVKTLVNLAFVLGAGVGLVMCKSQGVDGISTQDVRDYMNNNSIETLFAKMQQEETDHSARL